MILVTGAGGFIGGHIYNALADAHVDLVVACDPAKLGFTAEELLAKHEGDVRAIVHMGAISDTTCASDVLLYENNEKPTRLLSRFCREKGIPFIWASSASVYGNGDGPLNDYARSKFNSERMLEDGQCPIWYALRFFNVYGPGEDHKGKQASIVSRLARGELTQVFKPQTKRDFVHVSDCVKVVRWMLETLPPSGIYDVGAGVSRSIHEVMDITGAKCALVPMPDSLKGKYQFNTCADLTKLRAAGYDQPFLSLEEGVKLL